MPPAGDESSGSNLPSVATTTTEEMPDWATGSPLLPNGDFGEVKHEDGDELGRGPGGEGLESGSEQEDGEDDDPEEDGGDDDYVEGGKRRKSGGRGGDKRARVE